MWMLPVLEVVTVPMPQPVKVADSSSNSGEAVWYREGLRGTLMSLGTAVVT
jgi:hypothetical protein